MQNTNTTKAVNDSTWQPPAGTYQGEFNRINDDPTTGKVRAIFKIPKQPGLDREYAAAKTYRSNQHGQLLNDFADCFGRDKVKALKENGRIPFDKLDSFKGELAKVKVIEKDFGQEVAYRIIDRIMPLGSADVDSLPPGIDLNKLKGWN